MLEIKRTPSCKPPRMRVGPNENYKQAKLRHRKRFDEYLDACIMAECAYQASVCTKGRAKINFFRAFYGVEMKYIIEAGGTII